ncbi:hypothetical protein [Clostridium sp.]|uniref:hypothetical protein n=1 Tax=Clostridium sp. TaxID=1506 RepID=UPI0025BBB982|nr:hypothetical protein [Clostridium sp.]
MSILDIDMKSQRKQIRKTIWVYLILSVIAAAFDKVYGVFGHGINSPSMTWMFLYPLLGGALFYFIIERFIPYILKLSGYRVFCNIYNSGIATLTFGSLLKGIFDIAGTSSDYLVFFYIVGGGFIAAGLIMMFIKVIRQKRVH